VLELKVHDGETDVVLQFEHSLLALSKWEAKNKIAFLASREKTPSQMLDYFKAMLMTPEQDPNVIYRLSPEQLDDLANYINDSQTATKIRPDDDAKKSIHQITTSEVMYGWLVGLKIPFHPTETWHLNRLTMLVQVVQANNEPPKKVSKAKALSDWARMNAENKKRFNSNG
jgi:hypothetical protein